MKNRQKYNTVLFDLDGTLLDTSFGILKAVDATIESLGFKKLSLTQKKLIVCLKKRLLMRPQFFVKFMQKNI